MNFDLEHKIITTATDLFGFALKENSTETEIADAAAKIVSEVLERHPDLSGETLAFAMGRALGRSEGQRMAAMAAKQIQGGQKP